MSIDNSLRSATIILDYSNGKTIAQIGRENNISRQRVWQIVKKFYQDLRLTRFHRGNNSNLIRTRPEEMYVIKKLERRGIKVVPQSYSSPFDLLVGHKKKVEIKYLSKAINGYYRYKYLKGRVGVDFYIFIAKDSFFIVPSKSVENFVNIPETPKIRKTKRFYRKYKDNWSALR